MKPIEGLGAFLKNRREQAGLSRKNVARALEAEGVDFVAELEKGNFFLSLKKLKFLMSLYEVSPEEIVDNILLTQRQEVPTKPSFDP